MMFLNPNRATVAAALAALGIVPLSVALAASPQTPATPVAPKKSVPMAAMGGAPPAVKGGKLGAPVATADLTLDTQALTIEKLRKSGMKYMPARIPLSTEKPAGMTIVKEPTYAGTPRYGVLHVGNGPNKDTLLVIDDKDGGGGKLYVDLNRNGDLTDDGDSAWSEEMKRDGIISYGVTQRIVRASWADPKKPTVETATGPYSLGIYYREGGESAFMFRQTARVGLLTWNGQKIPVMLMENDSDGIYDRSVAPPTPVIDPSAPKYPPRPIWFAMNDGSAGPIAPGVAKQMVDTNGPFRMGGKVYEVRVSPDGARLTLHPSDAVLPEPPKASPAPGLLAVGQPAPDFLVSLPGGGTAKLSDCRGKVVVLDFWATWCGPCLASMPHLEGVYRQIKDRNDTAVLAVCVSDDRSAFDKWTAANIGKNYTFPVYFDPAGRDPAKSISRNKFGVSGIPTQFVIGKDGKVAAALVGYLGDSDHRLEETLKKLGIEVASPAVAATDTAKPRQTASSR